VVRHRVLHLQSRCELPSMVTVGLVAAGSSFCICWLLKPCWIHRSIWLTQ